MAVHAVLGSSGVVGRETISALRRRELDVRSVSRSAAENGPGLAHVVADLLDRGAAARALADVDVAYLTLGTAYSARAWRQAWPAIMRNVIDGVVAAGTHLVYFDNVYAYGRRTEAMTESTPIDPGSAKGRVRADLLGLPASNRTESGGGARGGTGSRPATTWARRAWRRSVRS